jgi:CobQ-like glutamine amidotransferase family enzyme
MELNICHMYPDVLNLYGDRGDIITLCRRLNWRGIDASVTRLPIGEKADLGKADLIFIGGGQDFEQQVLLEDLHRGKDKEIRAAAEDGVTFLTICGGYQMLGSYYETYEGQRCDFIGVLDLYTVGSKDRMIGNYSFTCEEESGGSTVVGFENHSGKTWLDPSLQPLAHVVVGYGNNGTDQTEGVRYRNVFGSYSHGPLLPKNPEFCDKLLSVMKERRYGDPYLEPLNDEAETAANLAMLQRLTHPTR